MDDLRSQFPVLERFAYLNAGTNGPVPRRALAAAEASIRSQVEDGRAGKAFMDAMVGRADELRARVAGLIGADQAEVALNGATTDGVNAILLAHDLRPGDEILTSNEEHPGVLAPLAAARADRGVRVRVVPFDELAAAVRPDTRMVVCSHVSWRTGNVVDAAALARAGRPVLLDGAQGLGAVPVDVRALGCDFYAASGQKWLCGPNGIGYLYARAERIESLRAPWSGFHAIEDPHDPLASPLQPDARRLGTGYPAYHQLEWALAALDVFQEIGIGAVQERAVELAAELASRLAGRGVIVAPRGRSTLVSFEVADPPAAAERLFADGIVLRHLPGTPYLRASVGAWNSDEEIERLAALVSGRAR
jgi:selenocysteine lyase/cysteine desulfurase